MIIGCDVHSRYQIVAMLEPGTGEVVNRRLERENGEAKAFYAGLPKPSLIGIEATGYTQWFERMAAELGHELWVGDPAQIWARSVRRQVTDQRAAKLLGIGKTTVYRKIKEYDLEDFSGSPHA